MKRKIKKNNLTTHKTKNKKIYIYKINEEKN